MIDNDSTHPGHLVRKACLEPHQLGVVDAARLLGVSRQALSNLVSGRAGISPEMAVRLAKVFGDSEELWLQRQLAHDLADVRKRSDSITAIPIDSARREAVEREASLF